METYELSSPDNVRLWLHQTNHAKQLALLDKFEMVGIFYKPFYLHMYIFKKYLLFISSLFHLMNNLGIKIG
jgi:hypothetical protein